MEDIAAWLRGLGLEQYEPAFRDNAIDADVLPELTAEDLKDLGVSLVGHRRKLLAAIAALRGGEAPPAAAPPAEGECEPDAPPSLRTTPRSPEAERRQLTVMFADLVGSTELAAALDPEDLREVIGAYQRAVADVVGRWGGHVAKYMGDGVLAYLGYPQAHEDDAERAVRAGLQLADVVGRLTPRPGLALHVRVGIATGLVVVGELIGEGAAREEAVVGETPNLAARLQALAEPGAVVIAAATQRLVAGLFDLAHLGAHDLKGFAAPAPAWRVLRPSAAESRFEARSVAGLMPLVGREEELALLLRRWEQAKEGEGQVVLLSGEPGIGKSRLVRALRERLADEPHTPLRCQCSPYHTGSALYPMIDQLERAAGFERDDPAEAKLAKLEALLAEGTCDVAAVAPLLADLLAVPTGGRYPPLDHLTPQRRKERLFDTLLVHLEGLAAWRPVLTIFEDVHWLDPTTEELLGLMVERVRGLSVLLVVTARPEFAPRWPHHAHVTRLTLNRLSRREGAAMVARVAGGRPLPPEVLEQIVARTDGVPLFVEELTKAVLESGPLREAERAYADDGPPPPLAIPSTLHDSLMARLDRLASAKEVAQIGAAIGREFPHDLLGAVAGLDEDALRAALDRLVEAGLVFRRGAPPDAIYTFKHALVRDAAYESLLRGRRRRLHADIARALEERFPHTVEAEPELLAHHCTEAGLIAPAFGYWRRAGRRAAERSANAEATRHLRRGLTLLDGLPAGAERDAEELGLLTALGPVLMASRGWAAPEVERLYARARALAGAAGRPADIFPAIWGWWLLSHTRGDYGAAAGVAAELLRLAEGDQDLALQAHHAAWATRMAAGDLPGVRAAAEAGLRLYRREAHGRHALTYGGHDPGVCGLAHAAHALWMLGHPEQAAARGREAVALARGLGHAPSLAHALWFVGELRQYGRDAEGTAEVAEALRALAAEQGLPLYGAMGTMLGGWALAARGRVRNGLAELRAGLAAWRDNREAQAPNLARLAEVCGAAGEAAEGLRVVEGALAQAEGSRQRLFEAELHRLRGALALLLPEPDRAAAEASFRRALTGAREQGTRMWELRAAVSLARLWRDDGRGAEARDLLAPIYNWFNEGFDAPDLKEAKALLDALPADGPFPHHPFDSPPPLEPAT